MDSLIKQLSAKTLSELQQLEKELTAKAEKTAKLHAGINEIHDEFIFLETLKAWQEEGCKGDEPTREQFAGAWQRLLEAKRKEANSELEEFERQVFEAARKINLY